MSTSNFEVDDRTDIESTADASESSDTATQLERTAAQVELLSEENRRLRNEYARAQQSRYRRTAMGLGMIGVLSVTAGLIFSGSREILIALGSTGLFGGVLTYYLTPGQFVAASVGERVYAAWAANGAAIADELELRDKRIYLPDARSETAQLYIPLHAASDLPTDRKGPIILEEAEHGLLLATTGGTLFAEFQRSLAGDLAMTAEPLAEQLCDGLVEQFELAGSADPDVDTAGGRVTIAISNSAFGAIDRFDHPIGSFIAVGLAIGLERSITLEISDGDDRADWLVTCRFETSNDSTAETESTDSTTMHEG